MNQHPRRYLLLGGFLRVLGRGDLGKVVRIFGGVLDSLGSDTDESSVGAGLSQTYVRREFLLVLRNDASLRLGRSLLTNWHYVALQLGCHFALFLSGVALLRLQM